LDRTRAYISATGLYYPEKRVTNDEFAKTMDTSDQWIRDRTGIAERRFCAEGEATSDMSAKAAIDCLDKAGVSPEEVDAIIVCTVTPDMVFPSTACLVQEKIKASKAWGFDLSAACSGFVFGLATGAQLIESGRYSKVLVIGSDTMTSIVDFTDRATCVLFGDGAGAVLLEPSKDGKTGILDFDLHCDGSGKDSLYMPAGGSLNPPSHETVDKKMHYVRQDGRTVFKYAVKYMTEVSEQLLKRNKIVVEDVALVIPHQANLRIINSISERLKLREDQLGLNIEKHANTTAATIPTCLCEYDRAGKLKKGDLILVSSFGAGFTWGSVLFSWGI
jgi:3-oxoacyl-[acyl-carrier-protein] synthase III